MCTLHYNKHISKLLSLMPNHCTNRVSFYSDDTTAILKLHAIFSRALDENDDRTVFGAFIPEPDWKNTPLAESDQHQYSFSNKRVR